MFRQLWIAIVLAAGVSGAVSADDKIASHPALSELDRLSSEIKSKYLNQRSQSASVEEECNETVLQLQDKYIEIYKKNVSFTNIVNSAALVERQVYENNDDSNFCLERDLRDQKAALEQLTGINPIELSVAASRLAYCAPILKQKAENIQRGTQHMARIQMLQNEIDALLDLRFLALEVSSEAAFAADRRDRLMRAMVQNIEVCGS